MPKGDIEKGKADIEDGYARVARLLLEAFACAPLTGAEFQVVFFIMRRTYGWATDTDPDRGKIDVMTAKDVAVGTGLTVTTAARALGTLVKENVVCQIPLHDYPGGKCAYGINTLVEEWYGGPEWRDAKVALRSAQEHGTYAQNSVLPLHQNVYCQYTKMCSANTQKSVVLHAVSPTAAGVPGALQKGVTAKVTENTSETALPPPNPPPGKKSPQDPVISADGEIDIPAEKKKMRAGNQARRADAVLRDKVRMAEFDDRVSKLSAKQNEVFWELVVHLEEKRDNKALTVNQQLDYLDSYRTLLEHHDAERVVYWMRYALSVPGTDDALRYARACLRNEEADAKKTAGGNGDGGKCAAVKTKRDLLLEEHAALQEENRGLTGAEPRYQELRTRQVEIERTLGFAPEY
jgi:phage replication O-like protein O